MSAKEERVLNKYKSQLSQLNETGNLPKPK